MKENLLDQNLQRRKGTYSIYISVSLLPGSIVLAPQIMSSLLSYQIYPFQQFKSEYIPNIPSLSY